MRKVNLKSATTNAIKNELKRLLRKYPLLDIDYMRLTSPDYGYSKMCTLEYKHVIMWMEGEELKNIEKCIQIHAIHNSKLMGFGGKIVCKLSNRKS